MWNHLSDYFKAPLNTITRALNPQTTRSIEERNHFEAFKVELLEAVKARPLEPATLAAIGRRGFTHDFRVWVSENGIYRAFFTSFLGLAGYFKCKRINW